MLEHVFQGYDAYVTAGGAKLVERSAERLMYARDDRDASDATWVRPAPALRALSFGF